MSACTNGRTGRHTRRSEISSTNRLRRYARRVSGASTASGGRAVSSGHTASTVSASRTRPLVLESSSAR